MQQEDLKREVSFRRLTVAGLLLSALVGLLGCQRAEPALDSKVVFVTIAPQAFLLERLAGDRLQIEVMVPPGQPPETYEPTPTQVTRLSKARVYFSVDVPFERAFLDRVRKNLPHLSIVDTTDGIEKREIEEHSHDEGEDHGHAHSHDHGIRDPHVWLDPVLMVQLADTMRIVLGDTYPEWSEHIEGNFKTLKTDLKELDQRISNLLEPFLGDSIYVFHPAYGYFCDRYGLIQVPVESAGKEPNSKEFVELIRKAKEDKVTSLFVQPQFSSSTVDVLAHEIGATAVRIDPLARDYLTNLESISDEIASSFSDVGGPG